MSTFFFFHHTVYFCYIGNFGKIEDKYLNLYFFSKHTEHKYTSTFDKDLIWILNECEMNISKVRIHKDFSKLLIFFLFFSFLKPRIIVSPPTNKEVKYINQTQVFRVENFFNIILNKTNLFLLYMQHVLDRKTKNSCKGSNWNTNNSMTSLF